jgi:hypothetical protein
MNPSIKTFKSGLKAITGKIDENMMELIKIFENGPKVQMI